MGDPITSAIVSTVVSKVGGKLLGGADDSGKKAAQAQVAETSRLEQQRKDESATADAERKKKAGQRKATAVIFGGADNQNAGVGNLGG